MMTTPTKTIGPLHFEDLEPKRFEDLVRQLAYDFRPGEFLNLPVGLVQMMGLTHAGLKSLKVLAHQKN